MALPPSEELSRWTVYQVTNWLTQCSLTAFRDVFIDEGIDGSKLMGLTNTVIDQKYSTVPHKKRIALKEYLSRIEFSRPPHVLTWNTAQPPPLPSRGDKKAKPPPQPEPDDADVDSDGSWSDGEFDDVDQDYIEPTTQPVPKQSFNANGQHPMMAPPEEEYEIPAEEMGNIRETHQGKGGFERRGTIVDRLKNELESRKFQKTASAAQSDDSGSESDGSSYVEPIGNPIQGDIEAPPPPRPPRPGAVNTRPIETASPPAPAAASSRSRPPLPVPQVVPDRSQSPPGDVYEIMNDGVDKEKSDDEDYLEPEPPISQDLLSNKHTVSSIDVSHSPKKREPVPRMKETVATKPPEEPPRPKKISTEKPPPALPPLPPTQGGWLHTTNTTPAPPQSPSNDLSVYPWYHGKIGREAAQRIFNREQKNGMFLIRKSERDVNQPYTLMLWYDRIWNIPIRGLSNGKFAAGKFKEGETQFSTIQELVEHFKIISLNLKSKNQVEGSHHLTEAAPRR